MNLAGSCDGCPLESYNLKLKGYNSRGESRTTGEREREREREREMNLSSTHSMYCIYEISQAENFIERVF